MVGGFTCPECERKIALRLTGHDLGARMEAPRPFDCPYCGARVIFKPWKWIFRLSFFAFVFLPMGLFLLGVDMDSIIPLLILVSIPLCFGLLTNKLVSHEGDD